MCMREMFTDARKWPSVISTNNAIKKGRKSVAPASMFATVVKNAKEQIGSRTPNCVFQSVLNVRDASKKSHIL